jgi:hypothetical protein
LFQLFVDVVSDVVKVHLLSLRAALAAIRIDAWRIESEPSGQLKSLDLSISDGFGLVLEVLRANRLEVVTCWVFV